MVFNSPLVVGAAEVSAEVCQCLACFPERLSSAQLLHLLFCFPFQHLHRLAICLSTVFCAVNPFLSSDDDDDYWKRPNLSFYLVFKFESWPFLLFWFDWEWISEILSPNHISLFSHLSMSYFHCRILLNALLIIAGFSHITLLFLYFIRLSIISWHKLLRWFIMGLIIYSIEATIFIKKSWSTVQIA